ncbi:unnamed protein product [Scytosiphon promiscuus]
MSISRFSRPLCFLSLLASRGGRAFVVPVTGPSHDTVSNRSPANPALCSWPPGGLLAAPSLSRAPVPASRVRRRLSSPLRMTTKKNPQSGVTNYRRPSAAIERGGGFFVPGLEGFRLRFVLAAVILGLLSLDGLSRPGMTTSQVVSEVLAGLAGVSLFVQALVDQQLERAVATRREAMAAAAASEGGQIAGVTPEEKKVAFFDSAALGEELEAKVMWAADILLQLTAACSFLLLSDGKVLARVGATGGESDSATSIAAAFERATAAATSAATSAEQGRGSPSAIIVKEDGRGNGVNDADIAVMRLLPSDCRQGVLCKIPSPPGGGEGDLVVLLGSTSRGSGAFAGMDRGWFERVCALIALPPAAAADAGGR